MQDHSIASRKFRLPTETACSLLQNCIIINNRSQSRYMKLLEVEL